MLIPRSITEPSVQFMTLCGTYVFVHLYGEENINRQSIENANTKTGSQYWVKNGKFSVHMDYCDEIPFFWMWLLLQGLREREMRGILDFVCRKLHIPTLLLCNWPSGLPKTILIWTVRFPGFEAHIDKTWRGEWVRLVIKDVNKVEVFHVAHFFLKWDQ